MLAGRSRRTTAAGSGADEPSTLTANERTQSLAALEQTGWRIRGPAGVVMLLGLKARHGWPTRVLCGMGTGSRPGSISYRESF
jgi:hypothetical protein